MPNKAALDRLIALAKAADVVRLEQILPSDDKAAKAFNIAALFEFIERDDAGAGAALALTAVVVAGSAPDTNVHYSVYLGWLMMIYTRTYPDHTTIPSLVRQVLPNVDMVVKRAQDDLLKAVKSHKYRVEYH
jgi:hypothetical protein